MSWIGLLSRLPVASFVGLLSGLLRFAKRLGAAPFVAGLCLQVACAFLANVSPWLQSLVKHLISDKGSDPSDSGQKRVYRQRADDVGFSRLA